MKECITGRVGVLTVLCLIRIACMLMIQLLFLVSNNTTFLVSNEPEVKYFPFSHAVRLGEIIQCRSPAMIGHRMFVTFTD